jgi:hypothetical protein
VVIIAEAKALRLAIERQESRRRPSGCGMALRHNPRRPSGRMSGWSV